MKIVVNKQNNNDAGMRSFRNKRSTLHLVSSLYVNQRISKDAFEDVAMSTGWVMCVTASTRQSAWCEHRNLKSNSSRDNFYYNIVLSLSNNFSARKHKNKGSSIIQELSSWRDVMELFFNPDFRSCCDGTWTPVNCHSFITSVTLVHLLQVTSHQRHLTVWLARQQ